MSAQRVGLMRLKEGVDIGLMGAGLTTKLLDQEDGTKRVEYWLTVGLAQPSPLDGQLHVEEIAIRLVAVGTVDELIEKFEKQKETKTPSSLIAL